jgi:hypothetical protein
VVKVMATNPLAIVQGFAQFDVAITAAGTHRLKLEAGGELLAVRPNLIHPSASG